MISEFKEFHEELATQGQHAGKSEMTSKTPASSQLLRISDTTSLGPTIRARRRAQSLRIDDAAALSGVSVDLLSRLENGKGSVRLDKLLAVLDSLGLALLLGPKDHATVQAVPRPAVAAARKP